MAADFDDLADIGYHEEDLIDAIRRALEAEREG